MFHGETSLASVLKHLVTTEHRRLAQYFFPVYKQKVINAFKCNLKELTTMSAWVPRLAVFGMRMPSGWLHRSCDSLARSVLPSCWVLAAIFFPSRPPPRLIGFFSTDVFFFSVTSVCSFPLVWGLMAGLRCCASHGGIISI